MRSNRMRPALLRPLVRLAPALLAALLPAFAGPALAKLTVVATTPDLGAVASAVGGDRVAVTNLAKPTEDPHFVDARPTHIVTLNRADALIEGGAELELGWLPPLIEGARNPRLAPGAPGRISASEGVQLLDIPAVADRSRGDIHAAGNPHFMMDPLNAKIVAAHIADSFCRIDAGGCGAYKANLAAFTGRLDAKMKEWSAALAPCKGAPVVTYHATWRYFAERFGLEVGPVPRAEAGDPSLSSAPRGGDREDVGRRDQGDPDRAVPAPEGRRGGRREDGRLDREPSPSSREACPGPTTTTSPSWTPT